MNLPKGLGEIYPRLVLIWYVIFMVDFVDSFGSGVCTTLQIRFSILAYMSSRFLVVNNNGVGLVGGCGREMTGKKREKIINK